MNDSPIRILAGSTSKELGARIAMGYGTPLAEVKHTVFSDGEFRVSIEETVRGKEVVIVQSTYPPTDNLLELLMLIDAAKRARLDQMLFSSAPTTRAPPTTVRPDVAYQEMPFLDNNF